MIEIKEGDLNDMSNYNVGADDDVIWYPGVYTCITVTGVMDNTHLVGTHLAQSMSNDKVKQSLTRMMALSGNQGFITVYIIGMLTKKWKNPLIPKNYAWSSNNGGLLVTNIKAELNNHKGRVYFYDTSEFDIVDIVATGTSAAGVASICIKAGSNPATVLDQNQMTAV